VKALATFIQTRTGLPAGTWGIWPTDEGRGTFSAPPFASECSMLEPPGRLKDALLPRYALESEIGRGGMATVYLAHDRRLGREVAVKVLKPELAQGLAAHRFKREISIAARLNHRHVVPLYAAGEAGGYLYYVMPFVKGETLRESLDRDGPFDIERTLAVARDVGEGLHYAHAEGVIHRDIKPQNILLTGGYAVITDFGVARAIEVAATDIVTISEASVGTPAYMSPEQVEGNVELGPTTDVYSLACMIHEMLTGHPPFEGETFKVVLSRQLFGTIPSASETRPEVPPALANAIQRALAKSPADRFDSVAAFISEISATAGGRSVTHTPPIGQAGRRLTRRASVRWAMSAALIVALALPIRRWSTADPGPEWEGRPESAVVLPFASPGDPSADLATEVAAALTRQLNQWETVRAVPRVSLSGTLFDLGIDGPAISHLDDGVRAARAFGVQALITVTVTVQGDTAFAEATLFDPRRGAQRGQPLHARGPPDQAGGLADAMARGILALDQQPLALETLRRSSANPEALIQEAEGTRMLESWRLDEAEESFRRAVELDSTYALALYKLAQTLYWRTAREPARLSTLGPEIARLSASAVGYSRDLPWRDSLHIRAFSAFQLGDYQRARDGYRSLLGRDSTDVYAWLMLGSVEFRDPWLVRDPAGDLTPRSDYNVAIHGFSEAVRLQPMFHLGYGHLFDLYGKVTHVLDAGGCDGFETPRNELLPPWEVASPERQIAFCPVAADSLVWVSRGRLEGVADSVAEAGARRLFGDAVRLLRRWAAFDPGQSRPHAQLTLALLAERARGDAGIPERSDSLARLAARHAETALGLSRDTVPTALVELANLQLAIGRPDSAELLADRAIAMVGGFGDPSVAAIANIYLASGRPTLALAAVDQTPIRRYVQDPGTGAIVPYGGAERLIERLRVLGSSGIGGSAVDRELQSLSVLWSSPRYTESEIALLRRRATPRIAIGLAFDQDAVERWDVGLGIDDPLWRALALTRDQPGLAADLLERAFEDRDPSAGDASTTFLVGLVAHRLGRHELAIRLLSRLDDHPADVTTPDMAWALRPISWFLRGEASEALGDRAAARDFYTRFTTRWATADSAARPRLIEATRRLGRLRPDAEPGR